MARYRESKRKRGEREPRSRYEREYISTNKQYEMGEEKMSTGKYGEFNRRTAETVTEDWAPLKDSPIRQEDNGSMNYKERKDRLASEDARKISSEILPQ